MHFAPNFLFISVRRHPLSRESTDRCSISSRKEGKWYIHLICIETAKFTTLTNFRVKFAVGFSSQYDKMRQIIINSKCSPLCGVDSRTHQSACTCASSISGGENRSYSQESLYRSSRSCAYSKAGAHYNRKTSPIPSREGKLSLSQNYQTIQIHTIESRMAQQNI